ncbi:MAG: helix-turn-helix domain-containing protein [Polyangiaceae bacterium]
MGARREPPGARSWTAVRAERLDPSAIARVKRRARAQVEELTLQELRRGLSMTQVDVARTAEMTQSELSRLESRGDHRISTLRRYVEALGGELEVAAVFGARMGSYSDRMRPRGRASLTLVGRTPRVERFNRLRGCS